MIVQRRNRKPSVDTEKGKLQEGRGIHLGKGNKFAVLNGDILVDSNKDISSDNHGGAKEDISAAFNPPNLRNKSKQKAAKFTNPFRAKDVAWSKKMVETSITKQQSVFSGNDNFVFQAGTSSSVPKVGPSTKLPSHPKPTTSPSSLPGLVIKEPGPVTLNSSAQVLSSSEKQGGRPEPISRMNYFRDIMTRRALIDLEAKGCKFTWSNNQPICSLIKKRLDRALCNVPWRHSFPEIL
ncbi:hypothetical protein REPUB_Repub15cG0149300 [Reevesia pubescens]